MIETIKVTLIRPPGCAHCEQAKRSLDKLKTDYPGLKIEEIDATSPKGLKLIQKHGIMSSPGILVNNEFFAMGGATEEQFRKKFGSLKKR